MNCEADYKIFDINNSHSFLKAVQETFLYQYHSNPVYAQWCRLLHVQPDAPITSVEQLPFLPIACFKTHTIKTTLFQEEIVFESSGTTQTVNSRHYVKSIDLYRQSFLKAFESVYGNPADWCIIGLLPSYLERQHSSLVYMVQELISQSGHPASGFYLYNHQELAAVLQQQEAAAQKTLLIGVTFALLDFAAAFPMPLQHTVIMETGGMKGRRKEMIRAEVHQQLQEAFGLTQIHSEYGMTELLSQAYSLGNGRFQCPPWMKVLVRDEEDPLRISETGKGVFNIIDLANRYSCSFIATEDTGIVYEDGSFEVHGRVDNSDIRGCSLMVVNL